MPYVVYAGAHLGYDSRTVPLGGGAAVGRALLQRWAETRPFPFLVLGSGERPPVPGIPYRPIPWDRVASGHPAGLSVRAYARLSREFERGVTRFLQEFAREVNPSEVCVLHNDIVEAGDFREIARLGFRQAAIFHVDVVDYVSRIYLRETLTAPSLARLWRGLERTRLSHLLPDVADLALGKQEACARHCELLVVPSRPMAEILRRAYPWRTADDVLVLPWGTIAEPEPPETEEVLRELRRRYDPRGRPVLLTLSRISPEKGQDLLLRALGRWERRGRGASRPHLRGGGVHARGELPPDPPPACPKAPVGGGPVPRVRLRRREARLLPARRPLRLPLPPRELRPDPDGGPRGGAPRPHHGPPLRPRPRPPRVRHDRSCKTPRPLPWPRGAPLPAGGASRMAEGARAFARARPFSQAADHLAGALLGLLQPKPAAVASSQ